MKRLDIFYPLRRSLLSLLKHPFLVGLLTFLFTAPSSLRAEEHPRTSTVGLPARLNGVVLPGSELEAIPLEDRRMPVIIRIITAESVEQGFRYDLEYTGFVPGLFDLKNYLRRKDRSSTKDLPPLRITVESTLPPGKIRPHELDLNSTPRPGGYRLALLIGAILWSLGLLAILLVGRRRRKGISTTTRPRTLAEHLQPLVEQAIAGKARSSDLADLERALIAFWTRKLHLGHLRPAEVLAQLRRHGEAGPLLVQLESWLHQPSRSAKIDIAALLAPYGRLPADALAEEMRP